MESEKMFDTREFELVGESFEDRQENIRKYAREGDEISLRREPENPYDKNAIAVEIQTDDGPKQLGYLSRDDAQWLSMRIDAGYPATGDIFSIYSKSDDEPVYGVSIVIEVERVKFKAPAKPRTKTSARKKEIIPELPYDFYALDVETANQKHSSICSVGLAHFVDGEIAETWQTLVNPDCEFATINKRIHGITPEMVNGAMKIPEMIEAVRERIEGKVVVHHSPFDPSALARAAASVGAKTINALFLDTVLASEIAWPGQSNYKLPTIARMLDIDLDHHNALSDAIASGKIFVKAVETSGKQFNVWAHEYARPYYYSDSAPIQHAVKPQPVYNYAKIETAQRKQLDLSTLVKIGLVVAFLASVIIFALLIFM
jgi:DNA polymerase III epsilon subunit-like protein